MKPRTERRNTLERQLSEMPHWAIGHELDDECKRRLELKDKSKQQNNKRS
jgi:hypothetical protein